MAKQKPSLTENINSFLDGHVYPEKKRIHSNQQGLIDRAICPILHLVGDEDDRFQTDVPTTSDCRFGVTASDEHRFDILVPLPNLLTVKRSDIPADDGRCVTFTDSCQSDNPYVTPLHGFGYLTTDTDVTFLQDLSCTNRQQKDDGQGSLLLPGKVLRRFHRLVQEAVSTLEKKCFWEREPTVYEVKVNREGPAVTLTFLLNGNTFIVSLLPAVNIKQWPEGMVQRWSQCAWMTMDRLVSLKSHFYLFAINPKGAEDSRKMWCSCFYPGEILLASQADIGSSTQTCRRHALNALLAVCEENQEDFSPVGARIIRTVFLHQCVQYPQDEDWEPGKLGRAFVDLFLALIQALLMGTVAHFFLPETNLLAAHDKRDLKPVADHLKAILNDIVQHPEKTYFLGDRNGRKQYTRLKTTCAPKF